MTQKEALKAGIKQQVTRLAVIKNDKTLASNIIDDIEFEDEEEKQVKKPARRTAAKKAGEKDALMPNPGDWEIDYDDE